MNKIKAGLMVTGIIVLLAMNLFAAQNILDSIAVISDHNGSALVLSGGKWKPAEINMPIYEGDAFRTKMDSFLEITFDDATIIKLGSNTDLKLSQMKRRENIATTVFSLIKGNFLAIVDKLKTQDSRFEVHTKMAIAAVKGTEFAVTANDSETNLGVFEGAVAFKGKKQSVGVGGETSPLEEVSFNEKNTGNNVLVMTNQESKIRPKLHKQKGYDYIVEQPKKLSLMANFKIEIEKMREEIKIIRELKQKGTDEVIKYRIKKKQQKEGKVTGESTTEITVGGVNENTGKIREKVQKILKAKLKKELYNEKSHAYRDLKFINEEMKADIHLGKTMTDVHGNRIRIEEFIYRPAANQVNLLSLTLREGRIDYLKGENIFVNAIDDDVTWIEWKRMWQKEWFVEPTNYLKEQRIVLSNVNDWVFMGTLYSPALWNNGGIGNIVTKWKLLKYTEILAFTKAGAPQEPAGEMSVANFIINQDNNVYVREHRIYGQYNDDIGKQPVFKGILDKTFSSVDEYNPVDSYWSNSANIQPTGDPFYDEIKNAYFRIANETAYNQKPYSEHNDNLFDINKLAMKHTRYYNDGSNLSLGIVLIDDYGIMKELPKSDASAIDKAIWLIDVILNSNVELIVYSNQFSDQKMGIDIVSKMLWWIMLNPQNRSNTTPYNEAFEPPENYSDPILP